MFKVPEEYRLKSGPMGTPENFGNQGAFQFSIENKKYFCIASDGEGWEHVSLSIIENNKRHIMPSWYDMCFIKNLFWGKEDAVIQFHPPELEYVNNHDFVLHLWRKNGVNPELPPSILVGIK